MASVTWPPRVTAAPISSSVKVARARPGTAAARRPMRVARTGGTGTAVLGLRPERTGGGGGGGGPRRAPAGGGGRRGGARGGGRGRGVGDRGGRRRKGSTTPPPAVIGSLHHARRPGHPRTHPRLPVRPGRARAGAL